MGRYSFPREDFHLNGLPASAGALNVPGIGSPVMPCILARVKGDRRPMFAGAMIAARMSCLRVATEQDIELQASKVKGGHLLHWRAK